MAPALVLYTWSDDLRLLLLQASAALDWPGTYEVKEIRHPTLARKGGVSGTRVRSRYSGWVSRD